MGTVDSPLDNGQGRHEGTQDRATTVLELVRLVGELQAKAETAAMWQGRAEVLAERLATAESRILALVAPVVPQAPQDTNPGPLTPVATTTTTNAPVPLPARLRALAPWLLSVLAIVTVIVLLLVQR